MNAPILTAHRFPELDGHLLELLSGLTLDDWNKPTICSRWNVKDIASQYTERWHHQRQIVDGAGVDIPIDSRPPYYPVLDTFMRALSFTYKEVRAEQGTVGFTPANRMLSPSGKDCIIARRISRMLRRKGGAGASPDRNVLPFPGR